MFLDVADLSRRYLGEHEVVALQRWGLRSLAVRTLNLSTSQRKPGGRTSCGFEGSERLSTELSTPLPIQPGGRPLFIEGHVQSINRSLLGRDRLAYRESGRSRALNQALNPTLSGTEKTDQTSDVEPCHLTVDRAGAADRAGLLGRFIG